jgi:hypothetical protein
VREPAFVYLKRKRASMGWCATRDINSLTPPHAVLTVLTNANLQFPAGSSGALSAQPSQKPHQALLRKLWKDISSNRESLPPKTDVETRASKLLAFVQRTDLGRLDHAGFRRAIDELNTIFANSDAEAVRTHVSKDPYEQDLLEAGSYSGAAHLANFATEVRLGVMGLKSSGKWPLRAPRDLVRIASWGPIYGGPAGFYLSSGSFFELLLWRAQELLGRLVHRIKVCQFGKCGKLYLAIQGRRYCSKQCGQNTRGSRSRSSRTPGQRREHNRLHYVRTLSPNKAVKYLDKLEASEPEKAAALRRLFEKSKRRTRTRIAHAPEARDSKAPTIKKKGRRRRLPKR